VNPKSENVVEEDLFVAIEDLEGFAHPRAVHNARRKHAVGLCAKIKTNGHINILGSFAYERKRERRWKKERKKLTFVLSLGPGQADLDLDRQLRGHLQTRPDLVVPATRENHFKCHYLESHKVAEKFGKSRKSLDGPLIVAPTKREVGFLLSSRVAPVA
jgi:hypothetical protein